MALSFRSSLLGKPSHDALLKLQEYEIKLLEVCIFLINLVISIYLFGLLAHRH